MDAPPSLPWKLYQNPNFSSDSPPHLSGELAALRRAEIDDLRSYLDLERRLRRDAHSLTRSLSLELAQERRLRAQAEAEAARCRDAADRAMQEIEEERRMLKCADAWREERVQMKLTEAGIVLEEKVREMAMFGVGRVGENVSKKKGVKGLVESPRRAAGRVQSPGFGREKGRVDRNLDCLKSPLCVLMRQRNLGELGDSRSLVVR